MPVMDGFAATRKIRSDEANDPERRRAPIFALSAAALPHERQKGLDAGVDGYLTKPLDRQQLSDVFSRIARLAAPAAAVDGRAELAQADAEIVAIIGQAYLAQTVLDLAAMRQAVDAGDWSQVARLVHSQKGVVGQFNAIHLEGRLAIFEQQIQTSPAAADFSPIETEIKAFCQCLTAYLDEISA